LNVPILRPMTFSEEPDWTPDEGSPEQDPKWRIYEKVVADCKAKYPDCEVTRNHFVVGRRSTVRRQVDVWVTANIAGHDVKLAIECRCYGRKIGIKDMDAFCGFLDDVSANKGVLVTTAGFTSGAEKRAKGADIDLRVMPLEEAEDLNWADYLDNSCRSWGNCWGSINWEYSESGSRIGHCSDCGEFHVMCGHCGHIAAYSPDGCDASIGNVHLRCAGCDHCFVLGVEKGDVCDIDDCKIHGPSDDES